MRILKSYNHNTIEKSENSKITDKMLHDFSDFKKILVCKGK